MEQTRHQPDRPSAATSLRHAHDRGHLAAHGDLRCGCGPVELRGEHLDPCPDGTRAVWVPLRRQLTSFVRAHFIYSDRTLCSLR